MDETEEEEQQQQLEPELITQVKNYSKIIVEKFLFLRVDHQLVNLEVEFEQKQK